jgi:hypothetical protein
MTQPIRTAGREPRRKDAESQHVPDLFAPGHPRSLERGWKESRGSPVAVVSDDRLVRGVITVFSWFGLAIRGVRPDRLDEAFTHLELTSDEQAWVLAAREKLEEQLGVVRSVRRAAQAEGRAP